METIFIKGSTMFEAQIGRIIIRLVRPKYWTIRNMPFLRFEKEVIE